MNILKTIFTFVFGNRLGSGINDYQDNESINRSPDEIKHPNHDSNNSFPWDEVDTLVIYAAHSLDDNPDKSFPSIKFSDYKKEAFGISADTVPHLTVLSAFHMEEEIFKWISRSSNLVDSNNAERANEWVTQKITEGWTHFLFALEPAKYAGDSYKWAASEELGLTFDE